MEMKVSDLENQMPTEQLLEESKWSTVKAIRDAHLKATDWVVVKHQEIGEALPEEFTQYRQTLRDIPQTFDNPDEVVWPQKPSI
ncbi:hypothetical protein PSECIP111951_01171 [Pseudoalteromonas holothuriae]|uniref:Phage tail assembly chaperone-like domain-containing protein n=1 Tax=Pseudoalteromonas holothuriae TaxID=2963714 RepID=A0A9W4VQN7_9GAMM|nr:MULTISPECIES: phage tail assembly chaperone [unclassified Pseudoalteromonas]CAH9055093.1 hypothetical protein PSECIP111951_01171 [Pseudoalteromonas sp. CIP111951]CAH9057793.1 hypothetical protein PSECIP111854_02069 [Pseudoalteromonas sp. CIP111854]